MADLGWGNIYVCVIAVMFIITVTNCSSVVHSKIEVTSLQLYPRSQIRAKKVLL